MSLQQTLKALSDPTRRNILELIKTRGLTAGEIAKKFPISDPAISRHLSVLKEAGLVTDTREGKFIYYEANLSVLEEILAWVEAMKTTRRSENGLWNQRNIGRQEL